MKSSAPVNFACARHSSIAFCDIWPMKTSRLKAVHPFPIIVEDTLHESFNGTFRNECLNVHWFRTLGEAMQIIEAWRREPVLLLFPAASGVS